MRRIVADACAVLHANFKAIHAIFGNVHGKRALVVRISAVVIPLPTAVLRDIQVDFSHARRSDVVDAIANLEIAIVDDDRSRSGRISLC